MGVKKSREWQIFQWYDGITPQFHWDLEDELELNFKNNAIDFVKTQDGCYRIMKMSKLYLSEKAVARCFGPQ